MKRVSERKRQTCLGPDTCEHQERMRAVDKQLAHDKTDLKDRQRKRENTLVDLIDQTFTKRDIVINPRGKCWTGDVPWLSRRMNGKWYTDEEWAAIGA